MLMGANCKQGMSEILHNKTYIILNSTLPATNNIKVYHLLTIVVLS